MNTLQVRQQLHHYIDIADDTKIEAIFNIMQSDIKPGKYSTEELAEFYNRLEKYNRGEMPGFSVEDAHNYVRSNKKSNEI